ncbi:hypothetical protein [Devosia elaeis]|uniref:hypothetical protein n=1 Tax=Devosia elaeis TaxID=1770058 RepID=UPI001041F33F|nr:hypothetical protein [Devosia elaeis]
MQRRIQWQLSRGIERLPHFLDPHQQRKTGIEPARYGGIIAPVFSRMESAGPLAGAQAIEGFAAIIAQCLALGVDTASKVGLEIVARLSCKLVMTELVAAFEGKGSAAQGEALVAFGLESVFLHFILLFSEHKTPGHF